MQTLSPDETLVFPHLRNVVVQYGTGEQGQRQLRLFHADQEISFDEPELFGFGETLGRSPRFRAGDAVHWGEGLHWDRIGDLLSQLVEAQILFREEDAPDTTRRELSFESPLPPATCPAARSWKDESEAITQDYAGRPLELGHLELVVPVFRVVHMTVDDEGRQVGESNTYPPAARIETPTEWRACRYMGNRYQNEKPMNVTALRSMRAHWPQMMAMLAVVREAFQRRYPETRQGWTVAHIERLTVAVLAVPSYLVMTTRDPLANGELPAAMASLFRVTDGLRMVMHQMLFVSLGEGALPPETPMTTADALAYAERNFSFHSEHAVCAGPQLMIEEFMRVLVDGQLPRNPEPLDPVLATLLSRVEEALDYGLLGLRAHAAIFAFWPAMSRCYDELAGIAERWADCGAAPVLALRDRLRELDHMLKWQSHLGQESARAARDRAYDDMFRESGRGAGLPADAESLSGMTAPSRAVGAEGLEDRLREALAARLGESAQADPASLEAFVHSVAVLLRRQQCMLRIGTNVQRRINALLGRPDAQRAFTSADVGIYRTLLPNGEDRLPHIFDELREYFSRSIVVSPEAIEIA